MSTVLAQKFFRRSAQEVAPDLLGKYLVRRIGKEKLSYIITETEAYGGFLDKASHASRGKTRRNASMFEAGGVWYVYFCYGVHWMLNIVTGQVGYPSAVLIRGIIDGSRTSINGPGKLTKFLDINGSFNGRVANKKTNLWIEDRGLKIKFKVIKKSPRVGVDYAGTYWARRHWRYYI